MTRLLALAVLAVLGTDIVRAEALRDSVSVRQPLTRLVRPNEVAAKCGVPGVAACTAFVGQRLDCDCEREGSFWTIRSRAAFIPVIVLSDATWVHHEREHIEDVRVAAEAYLQKLGAREFASSESCEAAAAAEVGGFPATMDRFKLESNLARHPKFATRLAQKGR